MNSSYSLWNTTGALLPPPPALGARLVPGEAPLEEIDEGVEPAPQVVPPADVLAVVRVVRGVLAAPAEVPSRLVLRREALRGSGARDSGGGEG